MPFAFCILRRKQMAARRLRSQNLAARGDLESFRNGFLGFAASDWLRHKARNIAGWRILTIGLSRCARPVQLDIGYWILDIGCWALSVGRLLEHSHMKNAPLDKPHVVIVGAGFGGLEAAKKLACKNVHVTVID